jgi:hypothetical protein
MVVLSQARFLSNKGATAAFAAESSKFQTPSSKEVPNSEHQKAACCRLTFGSWCSPGAWILVLGAFPLCSLRPLCEFSPMLDLATIRCSDFAACLNQDFEIVFVDGTLPVKLSEAKPWGQEQPSHVRQPFSLTFRLERHLRLPQGTYKMRHATLGEMEIFLVQVAADATSSTIEAVFN